MLQNSFVAGVFLAACAASAALAGPVGSNVLTNGSFESSPFSANSQFGSAGYSNLNGWNVSSVNGSTPFDLWFVAGTSTTQGATTQYGSQNQDLVPSFNDTAADGRAFVSLDADSKATGTLSQTVGNLNIGDTYTLSFSWAASQMQTGSQNSYSSALAYSLSGSALTSTNGATTTATITQPYGQSTSWMTVTSTFVATSAQEVLSFLAFGGPTGGPPVALLDNVSLVDTGVAPVPEPATLGLMGGMLVLGAVGLRRRLTTGVRV